MTSNGQALVTQAFPITGHHTPETIREAARAMAWLWRYLGHASFQGYDLLDPSDLSELAKILEDADLRSIPVLERLADRAAAAAEGPDQYVHVIDPDGGSVDDAPLEDCLALASDSFRSAARTHHRASEQLAAAGQYTACAHRR